MKTTLPSLAFLALLALLSACLLPGLFRHGKRRLQNLAQRLSRPRLLAANIAEGTHTDSITKLADDAITPKFLLVKTGSDADHVAVAGAADKPLGVCNDEADEAEDFVNVEFLSASAETRRVVASEAIASDNDLYTAANGMVQVEPTSAGTYYRIGKARSVATDSGDVIEAELHAPVKVVVIAKINSVQNATAAASDLTTSEALANALKANYNTLQADMAALATALAAPAEVKVLSS